MSIIQKIVRHDLVNKSENDAFSFFIKKEKLNDSDYDKFIFITNFINNMDMKVPIEIVEDFCTLLQMLKSEILKSEKKEEKKQ